MKYLKNSNTKLSTHFNSNEFDCKCDDCKETIVDPALIVHLEAMRAILGTSITITNGYRCANYQQQLRIRGFETSKGPSSHEAGIAADVTNGISLGIELAEAADRAGFKNVGIGKSFVHVDLRPNGPRRWKYVKS